MNVGETREINIDLPDNFEPEMLRGVVMTCTVSVSEIFQHDLAEVGPATLRCCLLDSYCNAAYIQTSINKDDHGHSVIKSS